MALSRTYYNTLVDGAAGTPVDKAMIDAIYDDVDALPAANSTFTAHGVLIGNGTGAVAVTGTGTAGQVLTSNGASADPTFQASAGGGSATVQTTTLTGTQNDLSLTAAFTYLRCNNASALVLTGFSVSAATPSDGARVIIDNIGTSTVRVAHQDAGSTAAYRVICPSTNGQIVGANGRMELVYDATTGRWREALLQPGAPIIVAFSAGDFTAGGSQTWTVGSGDVLTHSFIQTGNFVMLFFDIDTTTVGGTPAAELRMAVAGGFTVAETTGVTMNANDNGTWSVGLVQAVASQAYHPMYKNAANPTGTNWSASTNVTRVFGQFTFKVA